MGSTGAGVNATMGFQTIEQKQISRLKEELAQAEARLREAEAQPKTAEEMLFSLLSKVRGGKVASDRALVDQFIAMLKGEIMDQVKVEIEPTIQTLVKVYMEPESAAN